MAAIAGVSASIKALELDTEHRNKARLEQGQPGKPRNGTQSRMEYGGGLPPAYTQLSDAVDLPADVSQQPTHEIVLKIRSDDVD